MRRSYPDAEPVSRIRRIADIHAGHFSEEEGQVIQ
jgi:hypothetical protein